MFVALYNSVSGEGTFLALVNSLQFSASGERKFAAARGIRLQRASSDVYRAEIWRGCWRCSKLQCHALLHDAVFL
jgi:hypothetical protein